MGLEPIATKARQGRELVELPAHPQGLVCPPAESAASKHFPPRTCEIVVIGIEMPNPAEISRNGKLFASHVFPPEKSVFPVIIKLYMKLIEKSRAS